MSFKPRYCFLQRSTTGYGFNLHGEAPESEHEPINPHRTFYHVIKSVDDRSAAMIGGIQQDDRLIGVNGYYVDNKPHNEVVKLIRQGGDSTWLLVVDRETDEHFFKVAKRKPTFADAVYGQEDKRGEPVDLNHVPMEEERVEHHDQLDGGVEVKTVEVDEKEENEAAINELVSAVSNSNISPPHSDDEEEQHSHPTTKDHDNDSQSRPRSHIEDNRENEGRQSSEVGEDEAEDQHHISSSSSHNNHSSPTTKSNSNGIDSFSSTTVQQQQNGGATDVMRIDMQSARSAAKGHKHQAKGAGTWNNKLKDFNRL